MACIAAALALGACTDKVAVSNAPMSTGAPKWVQISLGGNHGLGIKSDGTLWAWGDNALGQLGTGPTPLSSLTPVQESTHATNWMQAAAGNGSSGALKTDGTFWAWGDNTQSEFGDTTIVGANVPGKITQAPPLKAIAKGPAYVVGIDTSGDLWAAGNDSSGTVVANNVWTKVLGGTGPYKSVAAGISHVLAIRTNGALYGWGDNASGEVGVGNAVPQPAPPVAVDNLNTYISVAAGGGFSLGVQANGTLWGWGDDTQSQIGPGGSVTSPAPIGAATNWVRVSAGQSDSHGIQADTSLWGWGDNAFGEVGNNNMPTNQTTPQQLTASSGATLGWISVVECACTNQVSVLALMKDGSFWGWGQNGSGQLGTGSLSPSPIPVRSN